jgi:hypothetical protein
MSLNDETVTISKERLAVLEIKETFLIALQYAGVHDWEGYGKATDLFKEWTRGETREYPARMNMTSL